MSDNNSHQDSSVESENDDSHVSPEVLAESIRRKTDALHAQGLALADQLERMAAAEAEDEGGAEDGDEGGAEDGGDEGGAEAGEVDTAAMMTELLETASDLVEVAHAIETARLQDDSE